MKMSSNSVNYKITHVDLGELDAFLEIDGKQFYFQFSRNIGPTLDQAQDFLRNKGIYVAISDEPGFEGNLVVC